MNVQAPDTQSRNASVRTDIAFGILGMAAGATLIIAGQQAWSIVASQSPTLNLAAEAQVMGLPLTGESPIYWYIARSGGIIAYLLLWLATIGGIVMSSKMMKGFIGAPLIYSMHEFFPLLAVIFATLHALVLLGDAYINFTPLNILLPFTGPYKPLWTSMGSLALYLPIALLVSFYARDRIGRKTWRLLHYSAFIAFAAAMLHGIMAGSDTSLPLMRGIYLFTGASVLFATIFRILTVKPKRKHKRADHRYQLSPGPELAVQRVPYSREIRRESTVPILMLSARGEEMDRVIGLEMGADDYIVKPFSFREVLARIRANLRRATYVQPAPPANGGGITIGAITFDRKRHLVIKDGEQVNLSQREYDLLMTLLEADGGVVARADLLDRAWGRSGSVTRVR